MAKSCSLEILLLETRLDLRLKRGLIWSWMSGDDLKLFISNNLRI